MDYTGLLRELKDLFMKLQRERFWALVAIGILFGLAPLLRAIAELIKVIK